MYTNASKIMMDNQLPLTQNQTAIWLDEVLHPESPMYNIGGYQEIKGDFRPVVYAKVLERIVAENEAFGISIQENEDGFPVQTFEPQLSYDLPIYDFSDKDNAREYAIDWMKERFQVPFSIDQSPLYDLPIIKIGERHYFWFFRIHHLVIDGWGYGVLKKHILTYYNEALGIAQLENHKVHSYKEYVHGELAYYASEDFQKDKAYWLKKFGTVPNPIRLPKEIQTEAIQSVSKRRWSIPKPLYSKIQDYVGEHKVTVFHFWLGILFTYFHRLRTDESTEELCIGIPVLNRSGRKLKNTLGLFTGVSPLLVNMTNSSSFEELLKLIKATLRSDFRHQRFPIQELIRDLNHLTQGDRGLFEVSFSYEIQNLDFPLPYVSTDLTFLTSDVDKEPMSIFLRDFSATESVVMDIDFMTAYFPKWEVERMISRLEVLVEEVLQAPGTSISQLEILPVAERSLLTEGFNNTTHDFPRNKTLVELFEEQVGLTPDDTALVFENKRLTYRELNEEANQLAHYVRNQGAIGVDDIVALQVERSEWMIVAILGVLKAGGAYLPIDPAIPKQRLAFLLRDSKPKLLIRDEHTIGYSLDIDLPIIQVDQQRNGQILNPARINQGTDLAYIIYTSGSTGVPKGVMIEHQGVVNMILDQRSQFEMSEADHTLQFASYTFDTSISEIWTALSSGATLVLTPKKVMTEPSALVKLIKDEQISIADLPPALVAVLDEEALDGIRMLITGGELPSPAAIKRFHEKLAYINAYGPTEATVTATSYKLPAGFDLDSQSIPIGRPISNTQVLILNQDQQLCPVGVPGELCIAGAGLARGYLNHAKLTREKFIPHPFKAAERLYRTGDLARWLPDGNIEFMGRIDYQMKVRGHRIEAGEIEQALALQGTIQSAVVVSSEFAHGKELIAYLVPKEKHQVPSIPVLRAHLEASLPQYMIPGHFVALDSLPLTISGKVNRKALPQAKLSLLGTGTTYIAPRNAKEELLAKVWQSVLRKVPISVDDNFFHVGGDSIKAIQITARLGQEDWQLSIKDLFAYPTIEGQANRLIQKRQTYDQDQVMGEVPLTAIQKRFFEEQLIDQHHYNQAVMLEFQTGQLDIRLLEQSFQALIQHHDMLRAYYDFSFKAPIQRIKKGVENFVVEAIDISSVATDHLSQFIESKGTDLQGSFNLERGDLIKAVVFRDANRRIKDQVLIAIHHLVVDGVSWRIILEDLQTLYHQLSTNQAISLPQKTASFQLWANDIKAYMEDVLSADEQQKKYWELVRQESSVVSDLPLVVSPTRFTVEASQRAALVLTAAQTQKLLGEVNEAYHTEINDVLLAALGAALSKTFGGDAYLIALEGHGREDILDIDISQTIGWFTSLFPFVLKGQAEEEPGVHLQQVKEALRRIPSKGIGYDLLRYSHQLGAAEDLKQPAISFNYLGDFSNTSAAGESLYFKPSSQATGESISARALREHALDISGMIREDGLHLEISYAKGQIEQLFVTQLLATYREELLHLIEHCTTLDQPRFTPSDFTLCPMELEEYEAFLEHHQLDVSSIEDIYPLSAMQEGMLFHWMMNPDSAAYVSQTQVGLGQDLDVEAFMACWEKLIERHAILRTAFFHEKTGGLHAKQQPLQVVFKAEELEREVYFQTIDLTHLAETEQIAHIEAFRAQDQNGFDLSHLALIRFILFDLGTAGYQFLQSNHHIIKDGWSLGVLFKELIDLYKEDRRLLPITPYGQYIKWLDRQSESEAHGFWSSYLEEYEAQALIPDLKSVETEEIVPRIHHFKFSESVTHALETLAVKHQVSLNTILHAVWGILLGRYNRKQDVVFGISTSGRSAELAGIENMVGMFINTIPARIQWSAEEGFADLLASLKEQSLNIQQYEHYNLAQIQQLATGDGTDLFDHIVMFENHPLNRQLLKDSPKGSTKRSLEINSLASYDTVHYGMGLVFVPGKEIAVRVAWNEGAWTSDWAHRIENHMKTLVEGILLDSTQPISSLQIIPTTEKQQLLSFNNTTYDYPKEKTLAELFEAQVKSTPENIALVFEDRQLTYRALDEKANQLAQYLQKTYAIQSDDIIALQLERSEWMMITILGVLKSGGAYLPIACDLPNSRVEFMLADSQAKLLLTEGPGFFDSMMEYGSILPVIPVDQFDYEEWSTAPLALKDHGADALAYVIYTSGSTGKPKGVMIEHRSISNVVLHHIKEFGVTERDRVMQFIAYTFDASIPEMFMSLLSGATLLVANQEQRQNPRALEVALENHQISVLTLTPGYLSTLSTESLNSVRVLITGGDKPIQEDVERLQDRLNYFNVYGPTESSVCVSSFKISKQTPSNHIPIGVPVHNTRIYILNEQHRVQPIGVVGELCIAGVGLARAYLNNAQLTAEKFVPAPFSKGERLYKTGDLARWLPDGNIEFLGRIDAQLKVRGFRIEAGEIEAGLLLHDAVQTAVVVAYDFENDKELVAYLVPKEGQTIPAEANLRTFLAKSLPDYMIPSHFLVLDNLPLTRNGKINRKKLPVPKAYASNTGATYVAPRNEVEESLVQIWGNILHKEKIGIHDNFFSLGGHSLRAIRLVSVIESTFKMKIALSEVFENPSIAFIASKIEEQKNLKLVEQVMHNQELFVAGDFDDEIIDEEL